MEYPKIHTLFDRDEKTHKVIPSALRRVEYGLIKTWQFTEKIDGTNIRAIWTPAFNGELESLRFSGRTDNAQIHADLYHWLSQNITAEKMRLAFPETRAVIYGEGYGAGIQKGGGAYSKDKRFIVFDVLVDGRWWLNWGNTCDVAKKLELEVVPLIGEMTLEDGIEMARHGFDSFLAYRNTSEIRPAEGIVGRTLEPLFDKQGDRLIIKLKTKDF